MGNVGQWINNNVKLPFGIDLGVGEALGGKNTYSGTFADGKQWTGQAKTQEEAYRQAVNYNQLQREAALTKPTSDSQPSGALQDGGYDAAGAQAAAGRASALSEIDRILGGIGTKRDQGLSRLGASYGDSEARLSRDRELAMQGYGEQRQENEGAKLRGTEQVDQFANNSYSNLRRLLLGANAGGSSVARELVPQIVSKAAGQRRQGVFDTYGDNEVGIDKAQTAATRQFDESGEDLRNQRRSAEESFQRSILEQEQDLIRQKQGLGGLDLGTANAQIAQRDAQLNNLFSQFAPQFSAKTVSTEKPDLGKYTVDRAAVRQGQGQFPSATAYYLPALRKKQQGQR